MSNENLVTPKARAKVTLVLQNLDQNLVDLLTVYEVAEYLRCDHVTVRKLLKKGDMESVRVAPKKILITKSSLRAFLERQRQKVIANGMADHRFVTDKLKDNHPNFVPSEQGKDIPTKEEMKNYSLK